MHLGSFIELESVGNPCDLSWATKKYLPLQNNKTKRKEKRRRALSQRDIKNKKKKEKKRGKGKANSNTFPGKLPTYWCILIVICNLEPYNFAIELASSLTSATRANSTFASIFCFSSLPLVAF